MLIECESYREMKVVIDLLVANPDMVLVRVSIRQRCRNFGVSYSCFAGDNAILFSVAAPLRNSQCWTAEVTALVCFLLPVAVGVMTARPHKTNRWPCCRTLGGPSVFVVWRRFCRLCSLDQEQARGSNFWRLA